MPRKAKQPTQESMLAEAHRLVNGDRNQAYDHPYDTYTCVGIVWGVLARNYIKAAALSDVPVPMPPELVIQFLRLMKEVRESRKHKRDNLVDIAGYVECHEQILERRAQIVAGKTQP